jgi:hypothetical protein
VGSEGEESVITRTQDQLLSQRETIQQSMRDMGIEPVTEADMRPPSMEAEFEDEEVMGFTPDDDLIDSASGFDPSPLSEDDFFEEQSVVIDADDDDGYDDAGFAAN